MGKAARVKKERRTAVAVPPPPVGKARPAAERMRLVWGATAGVVVLIAVVAGVLLATRPSSKVPPPATASASDRNAPSSLIKAAQAVGFHPTTEPGVGEIEGQPASSAQPATNPNLLAVGSKAPAFSLKTPEGKTVSLASYRGKTVLLEFFATWCPHCNAESPNLVSIRKTLPKSQYAFVSINADSETAPSVYAFHSYYGMQWPALLDPAFGHEGSFTKPGGEGPVSAAYRVEAYPTFYVIDPRGRIAWRSDGEQPNALLRRELTQAARS
jgi:peroxiredoxin